MDNIRRAIHQFWSQFSVSGQPILAYQSGFVVIRNAQGQIVDAATQGFPRITYELGIGDFAENTMLTANIWNRNPQSPGNLGVVDNILSQVMKAIPLQGTDIDLGESGMLSFFRNSSPFIDYLDDPNDAAITRGIVRYWVRNRTNI